MSNIYIDKLYSISLEGKYLDCYFRLISKAMDRANTKKQAKILLGYCEGHHIIPRSFNLGGETDSNNIVYLTAKEHILAHRLLTKFSCSEYRTKTLRAYHCMCFKDNGGKNKRKASLHELSNARKVISHANKDKRGVRGAPTWSNCKTLKEFTCLLMSLVSQNLSDPKIAKMFNVSATIVFNWRKKLKIINRRNKLRDKKWLYTQYIDNRLSAGEIAILIWCTGTAVILYLNKFNIPIRSGSERQRNVPKNKRGYFAAIDINGNKFIIKNNDPRFLSGELVPTNKGLVTVLDENGKGVLISQQSYHANKSMKSPTKGKIAINNGLINRYINPNDNIPVGWKKGGKSNSRL